MLFVALWGAVDGGEASKGDVTSHTRHDSASLTVVALLLVHIERNCYGPPYHVPEDVFGETELKGEL